MIQCMNELIGRIPDNAVEGCTVDTIEDPAAFVFGLSARLGAREQEHYAGMFSRILVYEERNCSK